MAQVYSYKRILLKLSGESLMGEQLFGIDQQATMRIATSLQQIHQSGLEIGVVIGGGNIFRGMKLGLSGMPRTPADHMGMLATLLNGIALQQALIDKGVPVCVMSALECPKVAEPYNWQKAQQYLQQGTVIIFVGGTGNPYFTTDTAAALRASEIKADVLIKATKVDGIYTRDPIKYPEAKKYAEISYAQILAENLQVMDATAVSLCSTNLVPIFVFDMTRLSQEPLDKILTNSNAGTWVRGY